MYEQHLYRKQLYDTMGKDDELVDTVKLHLREKIINKLKVNAPKKQIPTDNALIQKICNSLFIDYLTANRYFHTAAVFSPQSQSSRSQFNNEQLKSLFRIETAGCDSMLQAVLKQVMPKGRLTEKKTDSSCQTDDREVIQSLESKLSDIQFQYKQKMAKGMKTVEDSEQRFLKFKNQLNKRYKQELDGEIKRIRDYQIANIRMQEQQKCKLRMKEIQQQLDISYKNKMQKLREREAQVIQRVANKMKDIQSYNYSARQKMLRDLQAIKAREQQLERTKILLEQRELQLKKMQNKQLVN